MDDENFVVVKTMGLVKRLVKSEEAIDLPLLLLACQDFLRQSCRLRCLHYPTINIRLGLNKGV